MMCLACVLYKRKLIAYVIQLINLICSSYYFASSSRISCVSVSISVGYIDFVKMQLQNVIPIQCIYTHSSRRRQAIVCVEEYAVSYGSFMVIRCLLGALYMLWRLNFDVTVIQSADLLNIYSNQLKGYIYESLNTDLWFFD